MKKRLVKVCMALCLLMGMVMIMSLPVVYAERQIIDLDPIIKKMPKVSSTSISIYEDPYEVESPDGSTTYEYSAAVSKIVFTDSKDVHAGDTYDVYALAYGNYYLYVSVTKYDKDGDFYDISDSYTLYINDVRVDDIYVDSLGGAKIPIDQFKRYKLNIPEDWEYALKAQQEADKEASQSNTSNTNNNSSNTNTSNSKDDSKDESKEDVKEDTKDDSEYKPVIDTNGFVQGPAGTIYRLYNPINNKHLFTTQVSECKELMDQGWEQEDHMGTSARSNIGVYRLYNPATFEHLYTADAYECKVLTQTAGWQYDNDGKPLFYGSEAGKSVYRLYNPSLYPIASHHYTSDTNEIRVLMQNGWQYDNGGNPVFYLN